MNDPATVLQVVFDTPLRQSFDYLAPAGQPLPRPGERVRAPFGRQKAIGLVVAHATSSALPHTRLKPALEAIDTTPIWDEATFGLLRWAADYYHHPLGDVLFGAMPKMLRQGQPAVRDEIVWRLSDAGRAALAGGARLGARQSALVTLAGEDGATAAAISAAGHTAALRALAARGWLESFARPEAAPPAGAGRPARSRPPTRPRRLRSVGSALGGFAAFLLHGVTGSGKTEVYLRLIERVLEAGRGALVLVPEIALTPQLVARFRARLAAPVVALHSSLADGARLEAWRAAAAGRAPVVIGTRSAVFTPMPALGLVVVDEEHDASYKQQEGFRYSARDLAVARAQRAGVPGRARLGDALARVARERRRRPLREALAARAHRARGQAARHGRRPARERGARRAVAARARRRSSGTSATAARCSCS